MRYQKVYDMVESGGLIRVQAEAALRRAEFIERITTDDL